MQNFELPFGHDNGPKLTFHNLAVAVAPTSATVKGLEPSFAKCEIFSEPKP
jgi:hypothetical protein